MSSIFPTLGPWTEAALWHGLGSPPRPPDAPLGAELDTICRQRLAALLLRYVRVTDVALEPCHRDTLQRASFAWTSTTMNAAAASAGAVTMLEEHGITVVISKGPGIARTYPAVELRPFSDLDLLVDTTDFVRARALLEQRGWSEELRNRQPRDYFVRYCREGLNLHDEHGGSVDLHHRVPPWNWSGGLRVPELHRKAEDVDVGGVVLRCLAPVDNLMVAALHIVSDRNAPGQSLLVWRDIAQLASVVPVSDAVLTAERCGMTGWLAAVLDALPPAVRPDALRAALPERPIERPLRLSATLSDRGARYGLIATQFLRLPVTNGVAFALGMALPSRQFLRSKYPDAAHHYRQWWANHRSHWGAET